MSPNVQLLTREPEPKLRPNQRAKRFLELKLRQGLSQTPVFTIAEDRMPPGAFAIQREPLRIGERFGIAQR
jgi:hypothetical protein